MLDIQRIREQPDLVRLAIRHKAGSDEAMVDQSRELDEKRRSIVTRLQELQSRSNTIARDIGALMREGRRDEAEPLKQESTQLKESVRDLQAQSDDVDSTQRRLMLDVPNIPHPSVPVGATPDDNQVAAEIGENPSFGCDAMPHWELTARAGIIDVDRGAEV